MGPCTASSCCCQARNLPWAPVPTPHAAARPRNLSWAPVPPPHAAARSRVCHGSLYGLPLLLSLHRHTLCHVPLSGLLTLLVVSIFVIGCCMASHCCCLHRHTVAPHSGFGPVTAQMSEVCGDSKIDGTHLHVILTVSIISLPQQTPRAFKLKVQCSALI
ncbi:unnamed protein product [Staurois parvus]|uniref:Uncharacterized protein n=1 Tax=Staurois parvus TaxID=386267 RepID=A0ABN9AYJ5_9NEOB|nr:unnamed protein product [Staurois parvus]